jgi:hypothetical protein
MSKVSDAQIELAEAGDGDECPLCHSGTVEVANGDVSCRGECGSVVESRAPKPPKTPFDFDTAFQSALSGYSNRDWRKR